MAWICPECGRTVADEEEEGLRQMFALHALGEADADEPEFCGCCRWRYEPPQKFVACRRPRLAGDVLRDEQEPRPASATGTAWERTPWHATQRGAWEVLRKP